MTRFQFKVNFIDVLTSLSDRVGDCSPKPRIRHMKRMSKAEEALNRQIKEIQHRIDSTMNAISDLHSQREVLQSIQTQISDEMQRLKAARESAFASNKG